MVLRGLIMRELSELEPTLLAACRMALRQLNYDGDDKAAFADAVFEALTKAIAAAAVKQA